MSHDEPVLVLGATGTQGGSVVETLLARHIPVRALVREPGQPSAVALATAGVELAAGSFDDPDSLVEASKGARALFSMQNAPLADSESERRHARHILSAARAAGIEQVVHSSVSGAGAFHRSMPGFGEGRWTENYWNSKADVEDMVREAGFPYWTILKPAFLMENFARPKADFMFPDLVDDKLVTAISPTSPLVLVAVRDIGAAVAAAVEDPRSFHMASIELGGDARTLPEIAAILAKATGRPIRSITISPEEAIARGQAPGWVRSQQWTSEVAYPAKPADAEAFGLVMTTFPEWASANAGSIAGAKASGRSR